MLSEITAKRAELTRICVQNRVKKLEIFGSATGAKFDPERSDLDFLVEFQPMPPIEHGQSYFGLLEALQDLFGRAVDLVETTAIHNPYFLVAIEPTREVLYAA